MRLEVDAAKVGLKPGTVINGWAFTQFGGTVYWDKAGIVTRTPQGGQSFDTLTAWVRAQQAAGGAGLPKPIQQLVKLRRDKRNDAQKKQLRDYFLENAYAKTRATFAPLREAAWPTSTRNASRSTRQIPATLVFKERATPKPAYILKRGEYDQRGEQVEPRHAGVPAAVAGEGAARSSRPGAVAAVARPSADGPRRGQSLLAAMFRHRPRQDDRGLRLRRANRRAIPNCSTGWRCSSATTAGTSRR